MMSNLGRGASGLWASADLQSVNGAEQVGDNPQGYQTAAETSWQKVMVNKLNSMRLLMKPFSLQTPECWLRKENGHSLEECKDTTI